ncbi:MAG: hypothetical protein KAI66_27730 [Lentisphaeria bacterium]|nr:hypothetical protein [Lentisphaeria bacterium]
MQRWTQILLSGLFVATLAFAATACGDDSGTEADRFGIAAQCTKTENCQDGLTCLTSFKGGYCGLSGCTKDADCPQGSACVTEGSTNYCFSICTDKVQCNTNRTADFEANCSSNVTFVEGKKATKACLPPSN